MVKKCHLDPFDTAQSMLSFTVLHTAVSAADCRRN